MNFQWSLFLRKNIGAGGVGNSLPRKTLPKQGIFGNDLEKDGKSFSGAVSFSRRAALTGLVLELSAPKLHNRNR